MSHSLRLTAFIAALAMPTTALAQGDSRARAEAINDEGKQLFSEKRYLEAYKRFEEAARLSPEGRFYFNVCFTLNFLERYREAIDACEQVAPNGADEELLAKTDQVLAALREKVGTGPGAPAGSEPGDPAAGEPTGTTTGGAGPAGEGDGRDDPFALGGTAAAHEYEWSLGVELGGIGNLNMGRDGDFDNYDTSGAQLHLFGNFMLAKEQGIGGQGYLNFTGLDAGADNIIGENLLIVDAGAALFLQRSITDSISWAPLVGAHLSFQKPDPAEAQTLVTIGLRGEVSFAYAFGMQNAHAITATPALNVYLPAAGGGNVIDAEVFGLDQPSANLSLAVGYQYRFSTPFGSTPLIRLE